MPSIVCMVVTYCIKTAPLSIIVAITVKKSSCTMQCNCPRCTVGQVAIEDFRKRDKIPSKLM